MGADKSSFVERVFSSVADKYDLMNDLMSFGLHRLWKNKFVQEIDLSSGVKILDSACGTGDIAHKIIKKCPEVEVTLCDRNIEMLSRGQARFIDSNILNADFICADAENLPFADDSFDYYTIAFGVRNVSNIKNALSEALRVLKSGGRFLCLEFGHVDRKCLAQIYDLYSFKVIPLIGKYVTEDREAYEYLVNSIRQFPFKEEFIIMMNDAGFEGIRCTDLSAGVVNIYSGLKGQ